MHHNTSSPQPSRSHRSLGPLFHQTSGPLSFFNPTRAYRRFPLPLEDNVPASTGQILGGDATISTARENKLIVDDEQPAASVYCEWRSRNNRKGRHALVIEPAVTSHSVYLTPQSTSSLDEVGKGILRMFTQFPYWDISYLVAIVFTLGSILWVSNGFFVYLPLVRPGAEFENELLVGGGVTAFLGASIFEIGSVLLMFEAVNENRVGCFGWALRKSLEAHGDRDTQYLVKPIVGLCMHHHTNRGNLIGKSNGMSFYQYLCF